jgi:flagellar protein FliS
MNANRYAFAAYRNADILTISQKELILRLYQWLQRFLRTSQAAMRNREIESAHNHCQKAKDILGELARTLNVEAGGALAVQLGSLYVFLINEIARANLHKDADIIEKILPIIATLEEGWQQIPEEFANHSAVPASHQGHALNFRS